MDNNKDLYIEGRVNFIPLKNLPREIYNLVLQLDNEAHRFAITYHKKLRKKSLLK
jgi:excinuclease UvrABC nuclease subunit